ncbi:twin-arginine translocation signal domain-containing protein [Sphingosinicella sp. LHD-64]|uniref:twin-arginine translocation signal domain-containing protein n=1 Tax=Sphingosinicella sp. LHD-64 TaxID=3072139 RepID=UPI00280CE69D|nr:twin-arginine translocation signal domain-containing protein [Sphingosinicella sp. LHD-64]MDQ8757880.1 twin-arginine translocation signal domain-containing protein [Sphingosinicella sp. LHD-64]
MKTERQLTRRSFLGRVAGGVAITGGAIVALQGKAEAGQVSDNDSGPNSDPPGRGYTGVTDSDSGANSDRPNHGRSGGRRRGIQGCTDSDSGSNSDPAGRGRGTGRSDGDPSDPAGCGRR